MQSTSTPLDSHRTLWMGDLHKDWDADFVARSFKVDIYSALWTSVQHLGHDPITVKMVVDKHTGIVS